MGPVVEREPGALLGAVDAPAREDARDGDHVLLRVPAIHAECVQLEQLARVVLVQTARRPPPPSPPPPSGGGGRPRGGTPGLFAGGKHCGGLCRCRRPGVLTPPPLSVESSLPFLMAAEPA